MGARRGPNQLVDIYDSSIVPVGETIEITGVDLSKPNCYAGVKFYNDAAGTEEATASGGQVVIDYQTYNTAPNYEEPVDNVIQANPPTTVGWAANTIKVRARPQSVAGASHYQLVLTCNETPPGPFSDQTVGDNSLQQELNAISRYEIGDILGRLLEEIRVLNAQVALITEVDIQTEDVEGEL